MSKKKVIRTSIIFILMVALFSCNDSLPKQKNNLSGNEKANRMNYFREFYYLRVSDDKKVFSQEILTK